MQYIGYAFLLAASQLAAHQEETTQMLEYVEINRQGENPERDQEYREQMLKTEAAELLFPLSEEDQRDVALVEAQFDSEENMAGLAAPQIGIKKKIIIFAAPDDPMLKKWRPDLTQTMGRTLWINPAYEGIGDEMHTDYEGCFSVHDCAAEVPRFKRIRYYAFDVEGNAIEGEAEGFVARIIQHEIDHVNGILYLERAHEETIMTLEAYREKRRARMS